MGRGRCAVAGCGRFVRAGATVCRRHGEAGDEDGAAGEERRAAAERFRRRLARGEYRALFEPPLGEVLEQAAAERPLVDEIGALRVALARLLAEEEDASKLAAGVARLAAVAIQAARAQRQLGEEADGGLTEELAEILAELNEETERARAGRAPAPRAARGAGEAGGWEGGETDGDA